MPESHPSFPETAERGRRLQPLHCEDLSTFAKSLRRELSDHLSAQGAPSDTAPSHLQLLNMLARAAGHRNLQALQAAPVTAVAEVDPWAATALPEPAANEDAAAPRESLSPNAAKALTQFDAWGRLARWPHKFSVQRLAMWALWTRFEPNRRYTEREVNELLKAWTTWGDHVTPRRELVEMKLISRLPDCSAYWKNPQRPSDEVQGLLRALRGQQKRPQRAG
ncbi:DUF2087 domain-containing protein [Ideonella azotifigens]|uniref:DUF2087 domain-containing protein n=1 Tax=Ideonella azotifigens TaxID=513160 RepID=A0ABP3VNS6_9BURK|nr:DUF2087 domain-containing protein [Ideonella azotifigens]MCD2344050.1 DUF2087 domain-containing protein [Ideonella azotifigens]